MEIGSRDAHLTVLVPARNAADLLPGWLSSAAAFADSVVALDDGSTDATRAVLEAHPLVSDVLTNPRRETYHGWDDLGNRQRLVWAALAQGADWILFLDADERIAADDAKALRHLIEIEAQPGHAYGFEVFRMIEDDLHYDPTAFWVFRLFHASDATSPLGSQRLHFVPVPSGIERRLWLFTSIRIQHSGSLTARHRQARFEKYLEADPARDHQDDYTTLLNDPQRRRDWPPRDLATPALIGAEGRYVDYAEELARVRPAWTAVVIARNDEAVIGRALDALTAQVVDGDVEIIVVCSGTDRTAERARSYGVRVVQLPGRALPGEARNVGLWAANGEYITFPGSHVWLLPGALAARLEAHDQGWDMVTTSVANGNTSRPGWASYFLDHAAQTPFAPSGEYHGAPGHASYVTADVRSLGGFPEDLRAGEDTVVNQSLTKAGKRAYLCSDATFAHASPSTTVRHLVKHHFQRGRGLGKIIKGSRRRASWQQLRHSLNLPARRMRFIESGLATAADPALSARFRAVRPLVVAGATASAIGCWWELLRAATIDWEAGPAAARAGQPRRIGDEAPWLLVGGRPGEASQGLLAAGPATAAVRHLETLTRYACSVRPVRPALGLVVTSATITAEGNGTYTLDLDDAVIATYLTTARRAGVGLWLVVQPGQATFDELVERWARWLAEPDVSIVFDLRGGRAAPEHDVAALSATATTIRRRFGAHTVVAVTPDPRESDAATPDGLLAAEVLDLRGGAEYPHDVLRVGSHPSVLIYQ